MEQAAAEWSRPDCRAAGASPRNRAAAAGLVEEYRPKACSAECRRTCEDPLGQKEGDRVGQLVVGEREKTRENESREDECAEMSRDVQLQTREMMK